MGCSCGCGKSGPTKDWGSGELTLASLKAGDVVEVEGYVAGGDVAYKSKLLSMGLVRGVQLRVLQVAPLGDPIEVIVMSYRLSLRKEEAAVLKLKRV